MANGCRYKKRFERSWRNNSGSRCALTLGKPVMNGFVRSYDVHRGAGQIARDNGGADVFVHVSEVERAGLASLSVGDRLTFDVRTDKSIKRSFAVNLQVSDTATR
jgi:cold shock protein